MVQFHDLTASSCQNIQSLYSIKMQMEQLFERAAQQFEGNNYEAGLTFITHCINQQPQNSSLYGNRALCFAQLGDIEAAEKDLNKSLELNHLNYVSYFNLFSLQYRGGGREQALENLCCSLSCLYLLRAKKSRRELDVQRSISYADNNFEAYVLKSLMYLEEGRLKQALNYIEWALDINPHSLLSQHLKHVIYKKIDPYFPLETPAPTNTQPLSLRLKSTYKPVDGIDQEVTAKLQEFNQIYQDLIGKEGRVAQKLPRNMALNDKTIHKSYFLSELSVAHQSKITEKKQPILLCFDSAQKSETPTTKGELPSDDKHQEQNLLDYQIANQASMEHILNQNLPARLAEKIEQNLLEDETKQLQNHNLEHVVAATPQKRETQEQNLLEQYPQAKPLQLEHSEPKEEQKKSDSLNPSKKQTVSNSKISQASSSIESMNLYPIGKKKKIQFTIIGADIKLPGNHKDFYLTGNYNSRKGQRIRTNIKKLEAGGCKWYTCNPPTPISETKQTLEVKLYSKQYFSVNDELIGEGEIEVIRSGETKFPIYYKTKTTGFVTVRIDIV